MAMLCRARHNIAISTLFLIRDPWVASLQPKLYQREYRYLNCRGADGRTRTYAPRLTRSPLYKVFTMKRCLILRVPLLEFRTPILRFLYTLLSMIRIPFLLVILSLVPLQILFPTFPRLLKSPFWSGIISTLAVGLVLRLPKNPHILLLEYYCRFYDEFTQTDLICQLTIYTQLIS